MARTRVGTPHYFSPELWQGLPYTNKCDIWSLGKCTWSCCAAQMHCLCSLYWHVRVGQGIVGPVVKVRLLLRLEEATYSADASAHISCPM